MIDEPLVHEKVYHQLDWQWSWRGLTLGHFFYSAILGPLYLTVACIFSLPTWPALLLSLCGMAVMVPLQYERDFAYLSRMGQSIALPMHLSPFRVERTTAPFPMARQALTCPLA